MCKNNITTLTFPQIEEFFFLRIEAFKTKKYLAF